jgi:alpha/beta superfamily hydrolase
MPHLLRPRFLRTGFTLAAVLSSIAAVFYGGTLAFLYLSQERLLFRATVLPGDHRFKFSQPFEEIRIPVPGAVLDALYFPQQDSRGLVFFLHGNAGNVETWTTGLDFYQRVGYDLFMLDYRGYGKSTGSMRSETELHADVRAAWDAIAPRYGGKPVVVYGRSLGSGLAASLARDVHPALLCWSLPYRARRAAKRSTRSTRVAAQYPRRTDANIGEVTSPVVLLHGCDDAKIPSSIANARGASGARWSNWKDDKQGTTTSIASRRRCARDRSADARAPRHAWGRSCRSLAIPLGHGCGLNSLRNT